MNSTQTIVVETVINASLSTVWNAWTVPEHITAWNFASDDWACPAAQNDLRVGGQFVYTMAAKDGSVSFDFGGEYTNVVQHERIESRLGDGRQVKVLFEALPSGQTRVTEEFDPENVNPIEMQRAGWQAILENFRKHVESLG